MPSDEPSRDAGTSAPRIAVVIPRHRAWSWHANALTLLREHFLVDTFVNDRACPYPLAIRLWVRFEGLLFARHDVIAAAEIDGPVWPPSGVESDYAFVLDLSEAGIAAAGTPILRPDFDGAGDSLQLVASLVARRSPYLAIRLVGSNGALAASYLAMEDRRHLSGRLQLAFCRLSTLTLRAARGLADGSRGAIEPQAPRRSVVTHNAAAWVATLGLALGRQLLRRALRPLRREQHWSTAVFRRNRDSHPVAAAAGPIHVLPDDGQRFYADPFLFTEGGRTWLFVEELDYRDGKGVISCATVADDGTVLTPEPVLTRAYHLSYPLVFRHADAIYMIPETGQNRTVELYRAESFPSGWTLVSVLLSDVRLVDATLVEHDGLWWMFGAIAENGGSSQDELAIFYSDRLEGPWRPHASNPVKSDCRSARPAGSIVKMGDRLYRPAQDCEAGYGAGLVWMEIEELTPLGFREREIGRWNGDQFLPAEGLHTFNQSGRWAAFDVNRTLWKWRAAASQTA
jgi:hypothetical protein